MSIESRISSKQPESFKFSKENEAEIKRIIAKYPKGRQASAVMSLLDLAQRQQRYWQPWLDWADAEFGVNLRTVVGVMPISQPHAHGFHDSLDDLDSWRLGVLYRVVSLGGSLVLGLGFVAGRLSAEQFFYTACLDELFQIERWGNDHEAESIQNKTRKELGEVARFLHFLPPAVKAEL